MIQVSRYMLPVSTLLFLLFNPPDDCHDCLAPPGICPSIVDWLWVSSCVSTTFASSSCCQIYIFGFSEKVKNAAKNLEKLIPYGFKKAKTAHAPITGMIIITTNQNF